MRRAAKVDDNQSELVQVLRQLGCSVTPTHAIGKGFPDLAIGIMGISILAEIKDGKKVPSARKLTSDEIIWHEEWRGQKCILESREDCHALVSQVRNIAIKYPEVAKLLCLKN